MAGTDFTNLFSALFDCFAVISFGYIAGRVNIITPTQSHGIGSFIGYFALPALLFKSMVELDFAMVSWTFLLAIFLAKTTIFCAIILIALLIQRRRGLGTGSIYAIFATQSNDFALGYPIVKALYSNTYPELLQYIYLLAPISLLILNPIGMLLLEIDKQWRLKQETNNQIATELLDEIPSSSCDSCPLAESCMQNEDHPTPSVNNKLESRSKLVLRCLKSLLLNPIVSMVFIGLAFHFIFQGKVPELLHPLLTTLGSAFSATALFYLGLSMVGKVGKQSGVKLFLPTVLIVSKILILPIVARELILLLSYVLPITNPHTGLDDSPVIQDPSNSSAMNISYVSVVANYGFLYGTFPTAPSVLIYAAKYGVEVDRIASSLVVCTTLSAPMMYISAWTLTIPSMDYQFFKDQMETTSQDSSIIGLLCAIWCIIVFLCSKKFQRIPHLFTLFLTVAMFVTAFMDVISDFALSAESSKAGKFAGFFLFYLGVKLSRLYTASLAISLVILKYYGEHTVRCCQWYLIGVPFLLAVSMATVVIAFGTPIDKSAANPVFMFGMVQDATSFTAIMASLLICVISLVLLFRLPNLFDEGTKSRCTSRIDHDARTNDSSENTSESNSLVAFDEFENDSDTSQLLSEGDDEVWFKATSGDPQMARHILLLILLCISLLIGAVLTGWRLGMYELSGIYFEIGFLDSVFNFGQAFFVFIIFGFDVDLIIDPFLQTYKRLIHGSVEIELTPLEHVDREILRQCHVFVKHHLYNCKKDLVGTKRYGLRTYSNVFTGADLCSWLVEVGLAADRNEALLYGKHLMLGRVFQHVTRTHHFYDKKFVYRFESRIMHEVPTHTAANGGEGSNAAFNCPMGKCRRGVKQFAFERFLTETDASAVVSPKRTRRKAKMLLHHAEYDTESFTSEDAVPRSCAIDSDVANPRSGRRSGRNDQASAPQSKQKIVNLLDW